MRAPILCVALIGCAYRPGSFSHVETSFRGQRMTVGCIDLAVERRPDLTGGGTVLGYHFANRCDRAAVVDLTRVRVTARDFAGKQLELVAYDPNEEMRPLELDARRSGSEAIAYPAGGRLAEVCVDVAAVAHSEGTSWLCFASNLPPPEIASR